MPQGLRYNVDIVFCVDVSGSMSGHLEHVKRKILEWPKNFNEALARTNRAVQKLRVRVVLFADLRDTPESLLATQFFVIYQQPEADTPVIITQLAEFESFVYSISTSGGGDEPESALEALSVAIGSEWTHEGDKQRHVIVLFTDSSAHKLESRVGETPSAFRAQVPASLDELTALWGGDSSSRLKKPARRLIVFAPDIYPWNVIGDSWGMTIWLPSQAGECLDDVEFKAITSMIVNAI
jgi:hypothetical protein